MPKLWLKALSFGLLITVLAGNPVIAYGLNLPAYPASPSGATRPAIGAFNFLGLGKKIFTQTYSSANGFAESGQAPLSPKKLKRPITWRA